MGFWDFSSWTLRSLESLLLGLICFKTPTVPAPSTELVTVFMQHEMDTWTSGQKETGPLHSALWLSWELLPACYPGGPACLID